MAQSVVAQRESPVDEAAVAGLIEQVRASSPLVHCITNIVVANFTANVLLAAGAAPAMVDAPEESGLLAGVSGAVLINLGTVTSAQAAGMRAAVSSANTAGVPWILDPVAIGALPLRTGLAHELAALGPAIIRGNASEIGALTGGLGGRGVDSTSTPDEVAESAVRVARELRAVVAVSGEVDLITDGRRIARVASGTPTLTKVTGVGCALGALMGAFRAVTGDGVLAAVAATALVTVCGQLADGKSSGPGSFAVAWLDLLGAVEPAEVAARAGLR
jgi:hydroxyethylthiazole kinase